MHEAADFIGQPFSRSNYKNVQREHFLSLDQSHHLLTGIVIICPTTIWASDLFALLLEGQCAHSGEDWLPESGTLALSIGKDQVCGLTLRVIAGNEDSK